MPSSTSKVYQDLLNSTPVPVTVQRRVLEWATARQDSALLTHLATIEHLDPDVESALSRSDHADVLLAWANRPGRSVDVLVERLSKEKRATLLVGLAQRDGLPQEVYSKLADSRAVTVRWALLSNTSVDLPTRENVARSLAPSFTKSHQGARRQLIDTLGSELSLWSIFVSDIRCDTVAEAAFQANVVDDDMLTKIVNYTHTRLSSGRDCYELIGTISKLVRKPDLGAANAQTLLMALERFVQRHAGSRFAPYEVSRAADALQILKNRPAADLDQLLRAITEAIDALELREAVDQYNQVTGSLQLDKSLFAEAVIEHPQVTSDLVAEVIPLLRHIDWAKTTARFIDAQQWDHLTEIAEHVGVHNYLRTVGHHREVVERLLQRAFVSRNYNSASRTTSWLLNAHQDDHILPFEDLILTYATAHLVISVPQLANTVTNALVSSFGEDARRWEMFETLIVEYDGTLQNLLDTIVSLSN